MIQMVPKPNARHAAAAVAGLLLALAAAGCSMAVTSEDPHRLWAASLLAAQQLDYQIIDVHEDKGYFTATRSLAGDDAHADTLVLHVRVQQDNDLYGAHLTVTRQPVEDPFSRVRVADTGSHSYKRQNLMASVEYGDGPIRDSSAEADVRERIRADLALPSERLFGATGVAAPPKQETRE